MILRRYGPKLQSVEVDFDPRSLNEVGFRRDHRTSLDEDEFSRSHEKLEERELTATTEGPIQDEAEKALLDDLESQLQELRAGLVPEHVLVVENPRDDYPKTRDRKEDVIVDGENRLHFHWRIEPALRIGIYRRRQDPD